eukprot:COSAG05_NODE_182_length_14772_cov_42.430655_13_plen_436_part_00
MSHAWLRPPDRPPARPPAGAACATLTAVQGVTATPCAWSPTAAFWALVRPPMLRTAATRCVRARGPDNHTPMAEEVSGVLVALWRSDGELESQLLVSGPGGKAKVHVAAGRVFATLPSPIFVGDEDEATASTRDALDASGGNSYQVSDLELRTREDTLLFDAPLSAVRTVECPTVAKQGGDAGRSIAMVVEQGGGGSGCTFRMVLASKFSAKAVAQALPPLTGSTTTVPARNSSAPVRARGGGGSGGGPLPPPPTGLLPRSAPATTTTTTMTTTTTTAAPTTVLRGMTLTTREVHPAEHPAMVQLIDETFGTAEAEYMLPRSCAEDVTMATSKPSSVFLAAVLAPSAAATATATANAQPEPAPEPALQPEGGRVVGVVLFDLAEGSPEAYLSMLAVRTAHHGCGIGTALLQAAESRAVAVSTFPYILSARVLHGW